MLQPDVCIAGAGIVGLSLALELHRGGARVAVFDKGEPLAEASTAAAGMLAAYDPENPKELRKLSELSLSLYPGFLDRLFDLSGIPVPLHTSTTLQALPERHGRAAAKLPVLCAETLALAAPYLNAGDRRFLLLNENSLDPRELAVALLAAVRATTIDLRSKTPVRLARSGSKNVEVHAGSEVFHPSRFVDCTGAWAFTPAIPSHLHVTPRKGQMLAVALPPSLPLHMVIRTPEIYIVPRTASTEDRRAVIGATVEDAGFDKTVHAEDIARLRSLAADLVPGLAEARELETWAGLRPATANGLPLIGSVTENHLIASGHYRNGILLAPATARVMYELLAGNAPPLDLTAFSPLRQGDL
ncbi:MAG: FAD-dependent oxidoreductase [Acidobacteria bacterium]|nr:FAD-dependent oxidoreductase [Acidobacteriota bacterium]